MRRLVIDLADARPLFALPDAVVARIEAALPPDWELVVVDASATGTGDGGGRASAAALEAVAEAEVYMGFGVPADLLRAGPGLRWVHSGAAGVGGSLTPEMLGRDVVFTNSAGIHGPPVAETVMGYLLHFARGLDLAVAAQRRGRWEKDRFDAADSPVRELARSTVGVVGLGGLGREVAWRARALGARVVGTRRRPAPVEGVEGVEVRHGADGLASLLAESHYVVLTAPETAETRGLIGAAELAAMRGDAVLVNVARGRLVDTAALVDALEAGAIRGAALDVFAREPLADDDPLWRVPRLLITPHTSAYTHAFWERESALLLENLQRYLEGTTLRNVVDKHAGY